MFLEGTPCNCDQLIALDVHSEYSLVVYRTICTVINGYIETDWRQSVHLSLLCTEVEIGNHLSKWNSSRGLWC